MGIIKLGMALWDSVGPLHTGLSRCKNDTLELEKMFFRGGISTATASC